MKNFKLTALVMLLCTVCLCGCGSGYAADESTVFVLKDGSVVSTDVETFDEDKYSEEDLKTYIDEQISSYNDENGKDSVKRKNLSVKDGIATLTLTYSSASDYQKFCGTEIFTGSIAEALAAGYSFDDSFASVSGGEIVSCEDTGEFLNDSGYKVVIFRGNSLIQVKGTIAYVTTANTTYVDAKTIRISDGASIFDTLSSGSTEATEVISTEVIGTEAATEESSDGSVSEDDLLAESTEDTEVTFDFSEEEESTDDAAISQVYTYIIYK